MKTENVILMSQAREALAGKWGLAVGVSLLYFLVTVLVQSIPSIGERFYPGEIISFLIAGPLSLGLVIFFLKLSRNQNPKWDEIFKGFESFSVAFVAYLLTIVFTLLWALLLIVPGIIAAISYSMTFYILADNPGMSARDAIKKSKMMMMGYKWKLVCLGFRFLGWAILSILTLGIGLLWLFPYMQMASVKFYEDIKDSPAPPSPELSQIVS